MGVVARLYRVKGMGMYRVEDFRFGEWGSGLL